MTGLEAPENRDWYALFAGRTEWDKVREFMPALSAAISGDQMLWIELRDLMERAAREGMPFGRGVGGKGFKWPMARCDDDLGHLKMDVGLDHHRIYFTAPPEAGFESILLALNYGMKRADDPDWKSVQNSHIDEANRHYQNWKNEVAAQALGL